MDFSKAVKRDVIREEHKNQRPWAWPGGCLREKKKAKKSILSCQENPPDDDGKVEWGNTWGRLINRQPVWVCDLRGVVLALVGVLWRYCCYGTGQNTPGCNIVTGLSNITWYSSTSEIISLSKKKLNMRLNGLWDRNCLQDTTILCTSNPVCACAPIHLSVRLSFCLFTQLSSSGRFVRDSQDALLEFSLPMWAEGRVSVVLGGEAAMRRWCFEMQQAVSCPLGSWHAGNKKQSWMQPGGLAPRGSLEQWELKKRLQLLWLCRSAKVPLQTGSLWRKCRNSDGNERKCSWDALFSHFCSCLCLLSVFYCPLFSLPLPLFSSPFFLESLQSFVQSWTSDPPASALPLKVSHKAPGIEGHMWKTTAPIHPAFLSQVFRAPRHWCLHFMIWLIVRQSLKDGKMNTRCLSDE